MSQHKSHKHRFVRIVDLADQPVGISFDVEDSTDPSPICLLEFTPRFNEVIPLFFLADSVPAS